jgi:hypothetical protein
VARGHVDADSSLAVEIGEECAATEKLDELLLALRDHYAGVESIAAARIRNFEVDPAWRLEIAEIDGRVAVGRNLYDTRLAL